MASIKIMGENPDNFPKEPIADDTNTFTATSSALLSAINKNLICRKLRRPAPRHDRRLF